MSELTLTVVRLGLLLLMWGFIFSIVGVIRGDLYGTRIVKRSSDGRRQHITPTPNAPIHRPQRSRRGPTSLVVTEGDLAGTSVPLTDAGVLLGRNPECTIVLDDEYASGRHARVYCEDSRWYVADTGSTNGTYVNAQRVTGPVEVREGSRIRIGTTVLELRK